MHPIDAISPPKTGHAAFDRQTKSILNGNISGDTQSGSFIRAYSETKVRDLTFEPGHLQDSDLRVFREYLGMTPRIEAEVRKALVDRPGILYSFFSRPSRGADRTPHGLLLTGTGADFYEPLGRWAQEGGPKAERILDAMQDWLTYPVGTRDKALGAVAAAIEGLTALGNPEVDALVALAGEAEGSFPNFGAYRVLTDIGSHNWQGLPPALQRFEPAIDMIEKADPKLFSRARIAIQEALHDLYETSFGKGIHVESTSAMHLARVLVNDYPEHAAAPAP